jgi:hypothetical protein
MESGIDFLMKKWSVRGKGENVQKWSDIDKE